MIGHRIDRGMFWLAQHLDMLERSAEFFCPDFRFDRQYSYFYPHLAAGRTFLYYSLRVLEARLRFLATVRFRYSAALYQHYRRRLIIAFQIHRGLMVRYYALVRPFIPSYVLSRPLPPPLFSRLNRPNR